MIGHSRVSRHPQLSRVGIGVDPLGGQTECGIVVVGVGKCLCRGPKELHPFVIDDLSLRASPGSVGQSSGRRVSHAQSRSSIRREKFWRGHGHQHIRTADPTFSCKEVTARRGKLFVLSRSRRFTSRVRFITLDRCESSKRKWCHGFRKCRGLRIAWTLLCGSSAN